MNNAPGAGYPSQFCCSKCRRARPCASDYRTGEIMRRGTSSRVEITGRSKPNATHSQLIRTSALSRQYRCLDCGHLGWSNHIALARKASGEGP